MRFPLRLAFVLAGMAWLAPAQEAVLARGLSQQLVRGRISTRQADGRYRVEVRWPPLPTAGPGGGVCSWDGERLYHLRVGPAGEAEAQMAFAAPTGPEAPEPTWHWQPPVAVPRASVLLGGWGGQAVLAVPEPLDPDSPDPEPRVRGWSLVVVDLADGTQREVHRQVEAWMPRLRAVTVEGDVIVLAATGLALRVTCPTAKGAVLTLDFWKEAGIPICLEKGSEPNPRIFGRALLDGEGAMLLPVEPKVFLEEGDLQRAWSRLDANRKRELIEQGHWPVQPGKRVGWKGKAGFLRYRPDADRWGTVPSARFQGMLRIRDTNFLNQEFREDIEDQTSFQVDGQGRLEPRIDPQAGREGRPGGR